MIIDTQRPTGHTVIPEDTLGTGVPDEGSCMHKENIQMGSEPRTVML